MNMHCTVFGATFTNPLLTASGKWAWTAEQCRALEAGGVGGITTKSFSTLVRSGHPEPTVVERDGYTLNAVGLPCNGVEEIIADLSLYMQERTVPVIISIFGDTVERFKESVEALSVLKPDAFELNISCPNVQDEHGTPFAYKPDDAAAVVAAVRSAVPDVPLSAKLSANTPDIVAVALACRDAGVSALSLINTLGPGMAIDLESRKPILSNKAGGLSGPAAKPIAVRAIADVYSATGGSLPLIGMGGVQTGEDAIELMMAGASLVALGTATMQQGPGVFVRIAQEMQQWCTAHSVDDVTSLIGAIHTH